MSRTTVIVLIAVGAAAAGFAVSSAAERFRDEEPSANASVAAGPQKAELHWRETHPPTGEQLVFGVETIEVLRVGWRVRLSMENGTPVAYEVGAPRATRDRTFGLVLLPSCAQEELDELSQSGDLPVRRAERFDPPLPAILEPGASWEGTMSASGSLVARSCARVVFGTLVAVGKPADPLLERVIWITDHGYRLEE